ncbi:hypothetical protein LZ554_004221 [Drepanopeziza brunnea f. sp. 'monogermtubi']|nr:hypothetical protein LZ554_004221 [Drepanopeziza brunnea f. sp. 'monogermtubi']
MAFFSTYALYKRGTAEVVQWLASTAAACGFSRASEEAATETTDVKKKKKKKKGNGNGKGSGKAKSKRPSRIDSSGKEAVAISELPELAAFISQRTSNLETLPGVLKVLRDVIRLRKQWSKEFKSQDKATMNSNDSHAYFVGILETVHDQLQAGITKSAEVEPDIGDAPSNEEMAQDLSNLFAVLELEEPLESDQIPATVLPGPAAPPRKITYELDEADEQAREEEAWLQIIAFFNDFADLRSHILKAWQDYASGLLDLTSVAVTTNVAIEMVQRAETELLASLAKNKSTSKLNNYTSIASLIIQAEAYEKGGGPTATGLAIDPAFLYHPHDPYNEDLIKSHDLTCMSTFILLYSFLPVIQPGMVPFMKPEYYGPHDFSGERLQWREKFLQEKRLLLEFLPDICVLRQIRGQVPVLDEISRGLMDMVGSKVIPIWLVLACRLWLDIHQVLIYCNAAFKDATHQPRPTGLPDGALREIQVTGAHVTKSLNEFLSYTKAIRQDLWPPKNDWIIQDIIEETDAWINEDFFLRLQRIAYADTPDFRPATTLPRAFLLRNPLFCGLLQFRLNLRMEEVGSAVVNAWGALVAVTHLYNAVKQESPEGDFPLWEDLEAVIKVQGKRHMFIGDFPRSPEEYHTQFCLMMGMTAVNFAPNTRRVTRQPSKRGPRRATDISEIGKAFCDQYIHNKDRSDITFANIEKLLGPPERTPGENADPATKKVVIPTLTPVSYLVLLQDRMQADILASNLDYVALHMCCFDLLRDLAVKLRPQFEKYIGGAYFEKETELPFLVDYIFMIATQSSKAAEKLKIREKTSSETLFKAGDILKEYIEKEGSKELDRIRKACRGYDWLE